MSGSMCCRINLKYRQPDNADFSVVDVILGELPNYLERGSAESVVVYSEPNHRMTVSVTIPDCADPGSVRKRVEEFAENSRISEYVSIGKTGVTML